MIEIASKSFSLYTKTITVRVNEEQYEKYKQFCLTNKVQLNELVRFLLDRAVAGDDKELLDVIKKYESLNVIRAISRIIK